MLTIRRCLCGLHDTRTARIIDSHLPAEWCKAGRSVWFLRHKGHATAKSDIDLLVDSGLRGVVFFGLLEDVATAIDTPIDLLDVSQIEKSSRIGREIRENGVTIYG